jgi:cyclophilin family peptidyl-prolyl cis-trans isomerase/HEAT repeat protein
VRSAPGLAIAALLAASAEGAALQDRFAGLREAMLLAEDRRAPSEVELTTLVRSLDSREQAIVAAALRGLGRLERPALAPVLLGRLRDPRPAVRVEAAHALAQTARGIDTAAGPTPVLGTITAGLADLAEREPDPQVLGALARSLGRLPYRAAEAAERSRRFLLSLSGRAEPAGTRLEAARGLEALLRLNPGLLPPNPETQERLRALAQVRSGSPATAARIRRIAWSALGRSGGVTAELAGQALEDPDEQVRRLGVLALAAQDVTGRRDLLVPALRDPSPMVRLEALRGWGRLFQAEECGPIRGAVRDPDDHVALLAIDLLANPCPGEDPVALLWPFVDSLAGSQREKFRGLASWHRGAHAMVTLARIAPDRIRGVLSRAAADYTFQIRMYAARAAEIMAEPNLLLTLANDRDDNVREAALPGLLAVRGHGADPVFISQLPRPDYQLIITAARALAGSPEREQVTTALLTTLARITRERRETSRDARLALLDRAEELGDSTRAAELERYLADFDPAVARRAAAIIGKWRGRAPAIDPRPLPKPPLSLAEVESYRGKRLRVTMSPTAGGGIFEIELFPDQAPATVARVARRAQEAYYDELTFHRVVPNFVIQGGSPGANEYAGDGPYLRDEVGPLSHERGTLGISTRGRDTGDAQIFVNLVDNPRLDFDYTVWGRVVAGMEVVDSILEGDVMARVELVDDALEARRP